MPLVLARAPEPDPLAPVAWGMPLPLSLPLGAAPAFPLLAPEVVACVAGLPVLHAAAAVRAAAR